MTIDIHTVENGRLVRAYQDEVPSRRLGQVED